MVIFNSYVSLPEGKGPFMVTLFTFQGTLDASFFRFVTCVFDEFSSLFLGIRWDSVVISWLFYGI